MESFYRVRLTVVKKNVNAATNCLLMTAPLKTFNLLLN